MTGQASTASRAPIDSATFSDEDRSKDKFFSAIAELSNAMINAHGRDFAMGALILGARFIAENKTFTKTSDDAGCCGGACRSDSKHQHDHTHHKT